MTASSPRASTPFLAARGIDAVLFDAGGVFVLPDPTVLGPLLAYYGGAAEIEVHRRAHYAAMAAKSRSSATEKVWSDYDAAYVIAVGVPAEHQEVAAVVLGRTRTSYLWRWAVRENIDALRALQQMGVPVGVVSNASGQIADMLARSGVCQAGDGRHVPVRCVIDSHVVGVAKPDPAIFDHALAHFADIPRERVAYVGDSVTMDVEGARAAGLQAFLLDPHDDHPGADFERLRSVAELLG